MGQKPGEGLYMPKKEFRKGEVPKEFRRYADFEFHRWNDPHLNYGNITDILRHGSPDQIPPDYNGRCVPLVRLSAR